ncbi:DNA recombination and repair protein DMC1 [Carpediemonas membranifera]|uniref:DNA recombination and repair protein DMC1 n=1 Tax=Carpediemonas membranifera TaxID=201153 RepID=A0A8J6B7P6_9EUKA|nr:DNA recombination and repair protein DMC1 [Carpediemonas membranifera]|eukprot:KAG9394859.1 DNA recombination and repair protein DMC1 [Carpediemonas membranifera]
MSSSVRKAREDYEEDVTDDELEETVENSFHHIETLTTVGIGAGDVKKLREGGIHTLEALLMNTRKDLAALKGLSDAKIEKAIEAAHKVIGESGSFMNGSEYLEKRTRVLRISTGSRDLDNLLGGGIESMSITEAFGEFRTGKTQIAHTLAVTAQLPKSMNGGGGKVIFLDTEGTFRPERLSPICERFNVDIGSTLDNIIYARAYTHEQQIELLTLIAAKMSEEHFALIIVDSVTALFRVDFSGRGELAERQQKLGFFMSRLTKLSDEFNVAVYITNQVVADPGAAAMFTADPKKPIGGHILAHASTTRLSLRKGRGEARICKIYDSPNLPEAEATYCITAAGINDAE